MFHSTNQYALLMQVFSFGKGSLFNNCFITRLSHAVTKQLEISKRILLLKKKKKSSFLHKYSLVLHWGTTVQRPWPNNSQQNRTPSCFQPTRDEAVRKDEASKRGHQARASWGHWQCCQPDSEEGAHVVFSGILYLNYRSISQCNRSSKENN